MLFPNIAPAPQMRPGMGCDCDGNELGYAPGANALGYAPGARGMGYVAHMGYAPGARGLGAVSDAQMQAAWDAGLDGPTLDTLSAMGATDADIQALMAGTTDVASIKAKYSGVPTTEGTIVLSAQPAASGGVGQVPGGSTLLYTATVVGGPGDLTVSPDSAMSQFAAALSAHGMTVTASSNDETVLNKVFGTGAAIHFQFQILDTIGHAFVSDAKSVCDGVLQQIVGNNISTSNLSVTSTPSGSGAGASAGTSSAASAVSWLENNAVLIAAGVAGLVLLNNFTGKRR